MTLHFQDVEALPVVIGWDASQEVAFEVAQHSLRRHASIPVNPVRLSLSRLTASGFYSRPTEKRDGQLWDPISGAAMATEFAISRFFLPYVLGKHGVRGPPLRQGFAIFCDCDVLFRHDVAELLSLADPRYALQVVQHAQSVGAGERKMNGQTQTAYPRKNWSSVMLWNLGHRAHFRLTPERLNTLPGRDLHRFCWLEDNEIGALPEAWNWLEGISGPDVDPALVHFTRGGPWLPGYEGAEYAGAWREEAGRCFIGQYRAAAA